MRMQGELQRRLGERVSEEEGEGRGRRSESGGAK